MRFSSLAILRNILGSEAIVVAVPETAFDVDTPRDYQALLARRRSLTT